MDNISNITYGAVLISATKGCLFW